MPAVSDLLLRARGEDVSAGRLIEELGAEVEAFGAEEAEATLGVDDGAAKAKLDEFRAELDRMASEEVTATVRVDVDDAEARARLDALANESIVVHARLELDTARYDAALAAKKAEAEALTIPAGGGGGPTSAATSAASGGGGLSIPSEIPLIGGMSAEAAGGITAVAIPAITSLIAFLGALVASAAAAAAGLGALGVTAVAAFGPIAGLAALAVYQISQASQASTKYASAQQEVKSASESLTGAESSLHTAQDQRRQAVEALSRAEHDAAQQIRSDQVTALDQLHSAEEGVTNANYQARTSEEQLTIARQAARRALVDEQLAAEGATLGHKDSIIALAEARRNLRDLEAQQGTPGGPTGLDIRAARQQVADAEFQVKSTRVDSTRAQKDLNTAEQQGVSRNPQVVQARHDVATAEQGQQDALRKLNEAEAANRKAQAETVAQSPQVISAHQRVAAATQQIADAQRQVNQASERLGYAQQKASKAYDAMQRSAGGMAIVRAGRRAMEALQKATEPILRGLARGLRDVEPLLHRLTPQLQALGQAMGHAFVRLIQELSRPQWVRFFRELLRNSAELTRVGARGFILMLRIIRNIVDAGLPYLVRGLRDLNHWLAGLARGSKNVDLGPIVHSLSLWLKLSYQLGRVFLAFIRDAMGSGNGLVKTMTRGLKAWADWMNSAGGRNRMHQFFKDTLPLAKDLLALVGKLALVFLQLGQFLAPVLDPMVKRIGVVLDWLNKLLNLLDMIPAPIRGVFGEMITYGGPVGVLFHHLGDVTHGLGVAWHALTGVAKHVWGAIGDAIKAGVSGAYHWLHDHSPTAILQNHWDDITKLAKRAWGAIGDAITAGPKDAFGWLRDAVGGIANFLSARFKDIRHFTGTIWQGVAGNIGKVMHDVFGWLRSALHTLGGVFHKIWSGIADIVHGAVQGVRKAVQGIVHSINWVLDKLNAVKDKISGVVPSVSGGSVNLPVVGNVDPTPGFDIPGVPFGAKGMIVKAPQYVVGEEAPQHPEVVIASNPAYRGRNVGLWQKAGQMLGIPGFAKGGVFRYPFPGGPSPANLGRTDEGVDISGPGTPIAAIGDAIVTSLSNYFAGSGFGSPSQGLVYKLLGGAPKGYAPSSPYIYTFEDFNRRVSGGRLHAGQIVGSVASGPFGIETGWAASGSGQPLAQTTGGINPNTHYSAAGASFVRFITDLFSGKTIAGGGAGAIPGRLAALIASMKKLRSADYGPGALSGIASGSLGMVGGAAVPYLQKVAQSLAPRISAGARGAVGYVPPGGGNVVQQVWHILKSYGFDQVAAAGILGNAYREAYPPWNPASVGTGGGGLWGFTTPPRSLADLQAFAQRSGKPWTDVGIQTEFMLQQGGLALRSPLNAERSAAGAARLFEQDWEHAGVVAMSERIKGAKIALGMIQGGGGRRHANIGARLAQGALGLIGAELGAKELVAMPGGTEIIPGALTSRLTRALMGGGGPGGDFAAGAAGGRGAGGDDVKFVLNGDVIPDPGSEHVLEKFIGNRKVAGWVRSIAADEAVAEVGHHVRMEGAGRG